MKEDWSYDRRSRFGTAERPPEPPPRPTTLFGQVLGALAVFALLALLLWWRSEPPCDADLADAGAPCVETQE